jgi:hypothetical protein
MNTRSLLTGLLLILAVGGIVYTLAGGDRPDGSAGAADHVHGPDCAHGDAATAAATPQVALPADGVVVYYFHGRQRCVTCNKMETLAESVVRQQFADQHRDGWVVFKSIDVQTPETGHFVQDYQLSSAAVVMVQRQGGQDVRWRRLDEVWQKVRDDVEYRGYVADNLAACLRELGLEQG